MQMFVSTGNSFGGKKELNRTKDACSEEKERFSLSSAEQDPESQICWEQGQIIVF